MDRQQIGAKLVLNLLGLESVPIATFNQRLIIQKSIYLAQVAGVDLGYYYRWYLRGPYSPSLTSDIFGIKAELDAGFDDSKGWSLDEDSVRRTKKLGRIMPKEAEAPRAKQLELLASAHFLIDHQQVPEASGEAVRAVLRRFDKDYTLKEVNQALGALRKHGLLS